MNWVSIVSRLFETQNLIEEIQHWCIIYGTTFPISQIPFSKVIYVYKYEPSSCLLSSTS